MIEPTDEMLAAIERQTPQLDGSARRRVAAAVLAIIERDYRLMPLCAEALAGMRCERSAGLSHPRQGGQIEHMAHAPGGAVVTWS